MKRPQERHLILATLLLSSSACDTGNSSLGAGLPFVSGGVGGAASTTGTGGASGTGNGTPLDNGSFAGSVTTGAGGSAAGGESDAPSPMQADARVNDSADAAPKADAADAKGPCDFDPPVDNQFFHVFGPTPDHARVVADPCKMHYSMEVHGASSDGAAIVATSHYGIDGSFDITSAPARDGTEILRWTEATGVVSLGYLPSADNPQGRESTFAALSNNAASVFGSQPDYMGYFYPFRWSEPDGMVGLGLLTGMDQAEIVAVNADGKVAVGRQGAASGANVAFRWTESTPVARLDGSTRHRSSSATQVSADGSVVVGTFSDDVDNALGQPFRWTADAAGMVGLGRLPGYDSCVPTSITSDGEVVTGYCSMRGDDAHHRSFRWTKASGLVDLGTPSANVNVAAFLVNSDGSAIFGQLQDLTVPAAPTFRTFRWTQEGGFVTLKASNGDQFSPMGTNYASVWNGTDIIGTIRRADNRHEAARWTAMDGAVGLGFLSGTDNTSEPSAQSTDGTRVCGISGGRPLGESQFVYWDSTGAHSLSGALAARGVDLKGYEIAGCNWISGGSQLTIVGTLLSPTRFSSVGFVARLPVLE